MILAGVAVAIGLLLYMQRDIDKAQDTTPTKEGYVWSIDHNHFHKLDAQGNIVRDDE